MPRPTTTLLTTSLALCVAAEVAAPPQALGTPASETFTEASPASIPEIEARAFEKLRLTGGRVMPLELAFDVGAAPQPAAGARSWSSGVLTVDVFIDDELRRLVLMPVSNRAEGYQVLAQQVDGSLKQVVPQPERSFRGSVEGVLGAVAAGTWLDDGLHGVVIMPDGRRHWIEPLHGRVDGADQSLHVIYSGTDMMTCDKTCGVTPEMETPPHNGVAGPVAPDDFVDNNGGGAGGIENASGGSGIAGVDPVLTITGTTLSVAEIAFDADFEFFQVWGSVAGVENRVNSVMNAINAQYSAEVGILHEITTIIVRTAEPDPYSQTNAGALLGQFSAHWQTSHGGVQRDVAHLFTGKELDGGTIGVAFRPGVCNTLDAARRYGLSESNFSPAFGCCTDLTSHELGHNWDAGHCSCQAPSYTMNPSVTCANKFHPTLSIPSIVSYRNQISFCLSTTPLLSNEYSVGGEAQGDKLGRAVAFVDDVTGDDVPEIFVGAGENDEGGSSAGKVYMLNGATGAEIWSSVGENAGDKLGYAVTGCGTRVAASAPYHDANGTSTGRVYIYNAADGTLLKTLTGAAGGDKFGWSLAGGGDANDDGKPDLLVGAPFSDLGGGNSGAVYVYKGYSFNLMKTLKGEFKGDRFGWAVDWVGKTTADDKDDFVVGAPYNDQGGGSASGKAYVIAGGSWNDVFTHVGEKAGSQFGRTVLGPGSLNGDPRDDFVVGAPFFDKSSSKKDIGRVYAFSGHTGNEMWMHTGQKPEDRFGLSLGRGGDVNGDDRPDVVIGAPLNDAAASKAGRVYVISGSTGTELGRLTGTAAGDQVGYALAGWGSLDSDPWSLIAVCAFRRDSNGTDAGHVYVVGSPLGAVERVAGAVASSPCAADVVGEGGVVDQNDLLAVLEAWAALELCAKPCPPSCPADIDGDCSVDANDVMEVLKALGDCA